MTAYTHLEVSRLERQRDAAASHLEGLLKAHKAILEGVGVPPSEADIQKARAALEVAEGILATYCRTGALR